MYTHIIYVIIINLYKIILQVVRIRVKNKNTHFFINKCKHIYNNIIIVCIFV